MIEGLEMRMMGGGISSRGYFEKQLCVCVSKGMSTVSEEHTPVSCPVPVVSSLSMVPYTLSVTFKVCCYVGSFLNIIGKGFMAS